MEKFRGAFVRVELSNGHVIYGNIVDEDEHSIKLTNAMILYNNGKLWGAPEVTAVKRSIVEVSEYDKNNILKETADRCKNLLSTIVIYFSIIGASVCFFIAIAFG